MEHYETQDDYTLQQMTAILYWCDTNIGTDYEMNESASGNPDEFYAVISDLLSSEVILVREMENSFRRQYKKEKS